MNTHNNMIVDDPLIACENLKTEERNHKPDKTRLSFVAVSNGLGACVVNEFNDNNNEGE